MGNQFNVLRVCNWFFLITDDDPANSTIMQSEWGANVFHAISAAGKSITFRKIFRATVDWTCAKWLTPVLHDYLATQMCKTIFLHEHFTREQLQVSESNQFNAVDLCLINTTSGSNTCIQDWARSSFNPLVCRYRVSQHAAFTSNHTVVWSQQTRTM